MNQGGSMYMPKPRNWNLMSKEGKKLWELTEGKKQRETLQAASEIRDKLKQDIEDGLIEEQELDF